MVMLMSINEMLELAKKVISNAYSPYSHIRVAAVVKSKKGKLYVGVNVENASYGLTICAERVAIFNAISTGEREFECMLIYSPDIFPWPCGACRQVMAEFFEENTRIIVTNGKEVRELKFKDLWPPNFSFSKTFLIKNHS